MNRLADDLERIASATEWLWDDLRGQNLFITGGTGFFGSWLVESFCYINRKLQLDAHAVLLTRSADRFRAKCPHLANDPAIVLLTGDVRNFDFPEGEFPFVIHAATEANAKQAKDEPLEMLSTILTGTERTFEFAASHGTRKFLFTSSGAVYGNQPSDITHIPESYLGGPDPLDPSSVYAEGKRVSEQMCSLYAKRAEIEVKIARCFAFVGPYLPLDAHFAIGNFIGDVLAKRPIHIGGDGTPRRSYLYAADLAVWLWTMLFRAPSLVPINVGSANDLNIRELAETIAATLAPGTEIHIVGQPVPDAQPARYVPSIDRAEQLLGLKPMTDLQDSIRRTAAWYQHRDLLKG